MRYSYLIVLLVCTACKTHQPVAATGTAGSPWTAGPAWGALWQQRAAEYKALCMQAYQIAEERVEYMSHQQTLRPRAIVTDIDETILDNSPYTAGTALQGKQWSQATWAAWTQKAACDTVPGGLSFFKYAAAKGFTVYYVSNRLESEREGTLKNLQRYNFPFADNEHLILSAGNSNKEPRRQEIARKFEIAILVGDNLGDFAEAFYHQPAAKRDAAVAALRNEFGRRFIMIPNAMYGDWLSAIVPRGANADSALNAVIKKD